MPARKFVLKPLLSFNTEAVFKVQIKQEHSAAVELAKYLNKSKKENRFDAEELKRLQEREKQEQDSNLEHEVKLQGSEVYYGQTIQLAHAFSECFVSASKQQR